MSTSRCADNAIITLLTKVVHKRMRQVIACPHTVACFVSFSSSRFIPFYTISRFAAYDCMLLDRWEANVHRKVCVIASYHGATGRGAVQGPTAKGGLPHLLPSNSKTFDILCPASTRDYINHTNFRLCEGSSRVGR
jgi:hypothetical protein